MENKEVFKIRLDEKIRENLDKKMIISNDIKYKKLLKRQLYFDFIEKENRFLEDIKKMAEENYEQSIIVEKENNFQAMKLEEKIKKFLKKEFLILFYFNIFLGMNFVFLALNYKEINNNNFFVFLPLLALFIVMSVVMFFHSKTDDEISKEIKEFKI